MTSRFEGARGLALALLVGCGGEASPAAPPPPAPEPPVALAPSAPPPVAVDPAATTAGVDPVAAFVACGLESDSTCTEYDLSTATMSAADVQALCEAAGGVFFEDACPEENAVLRCRMSGSTTVYYAEAPADHTLETATEACATSSGTVEPAGDVAAEEAPGEAEPGDEGGSASCIFDGSNTCSETGPGMTADALAAACDAAGGTFGATACPPTGVLGRCAADDGSVAVYYEGAPHDYTAESARSDCAGTGGAWE